MSRRLDWTQAKYGYAAGDGIATDMRRMAKSQSEPIDDRAPIRAYYARQAEQWRLVAEAFRKIADRDKRFQEWLKMGPDNARGTPSEVKERFKRYERRKAREEKRADRT